MPKLLIITQICNNIFPIFPKASPMTPPLEAATSTLLNLKSISIEASVKKQTKIMRRLSRINPKTFIVAGRAIISAPTTVVDRLNTVLEKEAPLNPSCTPSSPSWCFSGSRGLVSLTKGFCFRDLLSDEAIIVIV